MSKVRKKGALTLSIQMIVLIIIALVILGFVLKFTVDMILKGQKTISDVYEDVQSDLIKRVKESGALLEFERLKFETKVGRTGNFYMAIRNIYGDDKCFRTSFTCVQPLKPDNLCDGVDNNIDVGSVLIEPNEAWFSTFYVTDVKSDEISILPLSIIVRNPVIDTYQVNVLVEKADKACSVAVDTDFSEYTSEQIYVEQKS